MEYRQVAGFLQERLAVAKALPYERRTPDVSAFIETCRLQQEVADALDLPARLTTQVDPQWTCALALKFARALYVDEGQQALAWSPRLHEYAHDQIIALSMLGKLFHASTSLDTAAKATAALISTVRGNSREEILGTLTTANQAVAQLQQPAMRRRLKRELAAVQQQEGWQLLSYEQLLTLFVSYVAEVLETLHMELTHTVEVARSVLESPAATKRGMQAEVLKAFKTTTELLPRLEPDRPRFLVQAAKATATFPPMRDVESSWKRPFSWQSSRAATSMWRTAATASSPRRYLWTPLARPSARVQCWAGCAGQRQRTAAARACCRPHGHSPSKREGRRFCQQ